MASDKATMQDKLDRLRDDFREWCAFPCNAIGASRQADQERQRFTKEIARLIKEVQRCEPTQC